MSARISTIALALIILYCTSCKKVYDYIDKNPTGTCDACKVTQFKLYNNGYPINYAVSYDKKGNLTSIIADQVNYNNYDYYFRYDKSNRVAERIQIYHGNGGGAIFWDSYRYFPNKVVDTTYVYSGNVNDPQPPVLTYFEKRRTELKQDYLGRFVSGVYFADNNPPVPLTFKYDKNQNLVLDPTTPYDTKINPYRTNKTWQVTLNNFSANNAIDDPSLEDQAWPEIVSYNSYGLPTKYRRNRYASWFRPVFGLTFDSLEVKYDCDISKINY